MQQKKLSSKANMESTATVARSSHRCRPLQKMDTSNKNPYRIFWPSQDSPNQHYIA